MSICGSLNLSAYMDHYPAMISCWRAQVLADTGLSSPGDVQLLERMSEMNMSSARSKKEALQEYEKGLAFQQGRAMTGLDASDDDSD
mmetsp:Transcript_22452/g.58553  ORF Transcript_22452/g.58553 Transcript_22452/m.58553 type:complete len:87 (+) Transcript_22452:1472-1732(+)